MHAMNSYTYSPTHTRAQYTLLLTQMHGNFGGRMDSEQTTREWFRFGKSTSKTHGFSSKLSVFHNPNYNLLNIYVV